MIVKTCLDINGLQKMNKDALIGIIAVFLFWLVSTISIVKFVISEDASSVYVILTLMVSTCCFLPQILYILHQSKDIKQALSILRNSNSKPNLRACSDVQLTILHECARKNNRQELINKLICELQQRNLLGSNFDSSSLFFHIYGTHSANSGIAIRFSEQFVFIEPLNPFHKPVLIKKGDMRSVSTITGLSNMSLTKKKIINVRYGSHNKQLKIVSDNRNELVQFVKQHYADKVTK